MSYKAYIILQMQEIPYITQCAHCRGSATTQYVDVDDIPLKYQSTFCSKVCERLGEAEQTHSAPAPQRYYKLCEHGDNAQGTNCVGAIEDLVIIDTEHHKLENHIQSHCLIGKL